MNYVKYCLRYHQKDTYMLYYIEILEIDSINNLPSDIHYNLEHFGGHSERLYDVDILYILEKDISNRRSCTELFLNAYKEYKRKETIKDILK